MLYKAHCAALAQGPHLRHSLVWPWRDPARLALCVAYCGEDLSHAYMPFGSSTAPSTTAWMLAHCGFTAGITRTSANGETAPQWNQAVQTCLVGLGQSNIVLSLPRSQSPWAQR